MIYKKTSKDSINYMVKTYLKTLTTNISTVIIFIHHYHKHHPIFFWKSHQTLLKDSITHKSADIDNQHCLGIPGKMRKCIETWHHMLAVRSVCKWHWTARLPIFTISWKQGTAQEILIVTQNPNLDWSNPSESHRGVTVHHHGELSSTSDRCMN